VGQSAQIKRVTEILGGEKVLGKKISTVKALDMAVREGLPYDSMKKASMHMDIKGRKMSALLSSSARTIVRRKSANRLNQAESDRLARLARITALAEEVFEDKDSALRWLHKPNRYLDGRSPLDLMETDPGAEEIRQMLGRIDAGVYG
jgi:putative toxin-antitoxin system antitoxin component (TIGR02293 family)